MEVQLRTDDGELLYTDSVFTAFEYAKAHPEIWKISWPEKGRRVRLVRDKWGAWKFEPMILSEELKTAWKGIDKGTTQHCEFRE